MQHTIIQPDVQRSAKKASPDRRQQKSHRLFRWILYIAMATLLALLVIDLLRRYKVNITGISKKKRRPSPPTPSPTPLPLPPPQRRHTKYDLCVISRVRNVPSLIPAWIEFNTLIGIQHFFIADDCSTSGSSTHYWLKFYEKAGLVTPFFTQPLNNCSNHLPKEGYLIQYVFEYVRSKPLCAWIGVIDADEYIVPISNTSLKLFTSNPANVYLRIPLLYMGHSAQQVERNESKLSTFLCGVWNPHLKSFAREEVIRRWHSSHHPIYYSDNLTNRFGPGPAELGQMRSFEYTNVDGCDRTPSHGFTLRHYFHLSFEEHMKVRGSRKYNSYGVLLPFADWNISQHYSHWLLGNLSCSRCGRVGESNALSLAVQLNKQIVHKYGSLVTDPAFHIYRGVPFPYPFWAARLLYSQIGPSSSLGSWLLRGDWSSYYRIPTVSGKSTTCLSSTCTSPSNVSKIMVLNRRKQKQSDSDCVQHDGKRRFRISEQASVGVRDDGLLDDDCRRYCDQPWSTAVVLSALMTTVALVTEMATTTTTTTTTTTITQHTPPMSIAQRQFMAMMAVTEEGGLGGGQWRVQFNATCCRRSCFCHRCLEDCVDGLPVVRWHTSRPRYPFRWPCTWSAFFRRCCIAHGWRPMVHLVLVAFPCTPSRRLPHGLFFIVLIVVYWITSWCQ